MGLPFLDREQEKRRLKRFCAGDDAGGPAARWWGPGPRGHLELDLVAESMDRKRLLVGEVKWSRNRTNPMHLMASLQTRVEGAPFIRNRDVTYALWLRRPVATANPGFAVVTPDSVLNALR